MDPAARSRRRYRIADTPAGLPFGQPARPRAATPALIALVIVAAVIGAFVGGWTGGGGSSHAGAGGASSRAGGSSHAGAGGVASRAGAGSTAATASANELGHELSGALRPLARARATGLARQRSAGDAAAQARAIAAIAGAYRTAAARVAAIPRSPAGLHALLGDLASSYQALAAAARAANSSGYRQLAAQIYSEEQQLRLQAASL
ncbi:MAG: hypothetical protein JO046_22680 [Solirubrobacterales bacterium]|nr:hypothetical protein [Solirubrobacterales bacterium]